MSNIRQTVLRNICQFCEEIIEGETYIAIFKFRLKENEANFKFRACEKCYGEFKKSNIKNYSIGFNVKEKGE